MWNGSDPKSLILGTDPQVLYDPETICGPCVAGRVQHGHRLVRFHAEVCEFQRLQGNVTQLDARGRQIPDYRGVMSDRVSRKVLVQRPSRVRTDGHGRSVWADPVESAELELVSTQMLKVILSSRDDSERKAIEETVRTDTDGVLARHPNSGRFEIIDDEELQAILDANQDMPQVTRPADATLEPLRDYVDEDGLSLVSTQALRKVLGHEEPIADESPEAENVACEAGGFNPYDNA